MTNLATISINIATKLIEIATNLIEIATKLIESVADLIELVAGLTETVAGLIQFVAVLINFVAPSIGSATNSITVAANANRIAADRIALAANSLSPATRASTCGTGFGMAAACRLLLSRVDEEHDADDEDEERFELEEVLPVGAARVVAGERVEREGAEEQPDAEPDELSLPVPHAASEALQLAQPVGGRFERLVPFAEAEAHLARAELGAAVEA